MILQLLVCWSFVTALRWWLCGRRTQKIGHALLEEPRGSVTGSLFHISYETTWANEAIPRWFNPTIRWKRELLEVWFNGGVLLMGIGQCMSLLLFSYILYRSIFTLFMNEVTSATFNDPTISPIVVPTTDVEMQYLVLSWGCTLIVLLIHEIGHAAAASMERLRIQGFGIFFILMFPGAYVRVEDSIQYLSTRAQLKIYSAGVWHNFCFALLMYMAIEAGPLLLPYTPYTINETGLTVVDVFSSSPLHGVLQTGDVLARINGISLDQIERFEFVGKGYSSLLKTTLSASETEINAFVESLGFSKERVSLSHAPVLGAGFCRDVDFLQMRYDERHAELSERLYDPKDCCKDTLLGINTHSDGYCFAIHKMEQKYSKKVVRGQTENKGYFYDSSRYAYDTLTCLSARDVLISDTRTNSERRAEIGAAYQHRFDEPEEDILDKMKRNHDFCMSDNDCFASGQNMGRKLQCLRPLSVYPLTLLKIDFVNRADSLIVEYSPISLLSVLKLSRFSITSAELSEKLSAFPSIYKMVLQFPSYCHFFCWLCVQVISLSLSVGFLNMMPARYLDGGLAFPQFAKLFISRRWSGWLSDIIVGFGSALIVLNFTVFVLPLLSPIYDIVAAYLPQLVPAERV